MARYIDADLLKKNIAKWLQGGDPQETEMVQLDDIAVSVIMEIDEQPTAYSVEKVVEELEMLSTEVKMILPFSKEAIETKEIASGDAIEIIRRGGMK